MILDTSFCINTGSDLLGGLTDFAFFFQKKIKSTASATERLFVSRGGFEPPTQGFSVLCSNQLSYLDSTKTRLFTFFNTKHIQTIIQ